MSFWIHCNVSGEPTDTPLLVADAGGVVFVGDLKVKGRCSFSVPDTINAGFTIMWAGKSTRGIFPPYPRKPNYEAAELSPPPPEPPITALEYAPAISRLVAQGEFFFRQDTGERYVLGLHTDFQLFWRYLHGEDISGLLASRGETDGPRVFLTCDFLFKLGVRDYTQQQLLEFSRYLQTGGYYWEATVFADAQRIPPDEQKLHWYTVCETLANEPNVIVELANENAKNGVDARQFSAPNHRPNVSSGSYCDGWEPTAQWGDYVTFHPRRDHKWPYTVPMTTYEVRGYPGQGKPVLINEPIGAAEFNEPGRRSNNASEFERMASSCRDFAAGAVFHSQDGLNSLPWGQAQSACAEAFFRGLKR